MIWNKNTIKALRAHRGLSREKFGQDINFSGSAVQKWEWGINTPDARAKIELDKMWKWCDKPRLDTSGQSE
jgi:DNA-binding transcriptional regulator YiaG